MITLLTINSVGRFQECTRKDGGKQILPSGSSKNGCRQKHTKSKWNEEIKWTKNKHMSKSVSSEFKANYIFCKTLYYMYMYLTECELFSTPHLQHWDSLSSFHLQLLCLSPISLCWLLYHSTQAKWEICISTHLPGSQKTWLPETLLWNDSNPFNLFFLASFPFSQY